MYTFCTVSYTHLDVYKRQGMQEVKFVVRKDYPASPPRLFFTHDVNFY